MQTKSRLYNQPTVAFSSRLYNLPTVAFSSSCNLTRQSFSVLFSVLLIDCFCLCDYIYIYHTNAIIIYIYIYGNNVFDICYNINCTWGRTYLYNRF